MHLKCACVCERFCDMQTNDHRCDTRELLTATKDPIRRGNHFTTPALAVDSTCAIYITHTHRDAYATAALHLHTHTRSHTQELIRFDILSPNKESPKDGRAFAYAARLRSMQMCAPIRTVDCRGRRRRRRPPEALHNLVHGSRCEADASKRFINST